MKTKKTTSLVKKSYVKQGLSAIVMIVAIAVTTIMAIVIVMASTPPRQPTITMGINAIGAVFIVIEVAFIVTVVVTMSRALLL